MTEWLVRQAGSAPIGPVSTELVARGIEAGKVSLTAEVCRVGTADWLPIDMVDEFAHVAYDEEAATRVTDSPWFMDGASQPSRPRIAPPPPPERSRPASPGLPARPVSSPRAAAPAPPSRSLPRMPVPSAPRHAPPPPRPPPPAAPAALAYGDVDDEAMTRVAGAPSEAGSAAYEFDDETMTRVAAPRAPSEPIGARAKKPGLLKTVPMAPDELPPIPAVRPAAGEPARRPPTPRPAAGLPASESSIQVRPDLLPGPAAPPAFPPAPAGFGAAPAAPPAAYPTAGYPPAGPEAYGQPPPTYGAPGPPRPRASGDGGVKALIALIALLFLALMVVLILLVLRR